MARVSPPDLAGGTPSWGTPWPGLGYLRVLPERTWDQLKYYGMEIGYPPREDMGPVEVLWDGNWVPPRCELQTN